MADFASVLKRAIDALGDKASGARGREAVYKRARDTLANRLAMVGPMPDALADRQVQALEDAISEVERSYADQDENGPTSQIVGMAPTPVPTVPEDASRYEVASQPEPSLPPAASAAEPADSPQTAAGRSSTMDLEGSAGLAALVSDQADAGETAEPMDGAGALADNELSLVSQMTRLNGSALAYALQIGWGDSSVCAVCQRWALCIDQTHCWQRSPAPPAAPGPAIAV